MSWRTTLGIIWVLTALAVAAQGEEQSEETTPAQGAAEADSNEIASAENESEDNKANSSADGDSDDEEISAPKTASPAPAPRPETLRPWISKLDKGTEEERQKAYEALVAGGAATAKLMRLNLRYYNRFQRLAGVKVLQNIHTANARIALADRALFDRDRDVRKAAAAAIREMGGKTARNYIVSKAMSENEGTMKKAARAIANIGDISYMDALVAEYREYVAGSVRVRGSLTAFDPARSRTETMRRTTVTGGATGARSIGVVDMPMQLPVVERVRFETTVLVFCEITGQKDIKDMEAAIAWWRAHRDNFRFADLDE